MTRKPIADAVRAAGGDFNRPGALKAFNDAMDVLGVAPDSSPRAMGDLQAFYKGVRSVTGRLDQMQVDVIEALLSEGAHWRLSWLAYGLATAWHEARLRPVEEIGKGKGRPYGVPGKHGQAQYGRGLVQLTWDRNYETADDRLGLGGALVRDFDKALEPDIAVKILVRGMEEGWFTGKKLSDYLPSERGAPTGFISARRIINGTDRAELIAGYAQQFQAAATVGGWA